MKFTIFIENYINGALKNSGRRKPGLQIMPKLEIHFKQMNHSDIKMIFVTSFGFLTVMISHSYSFSF